MMLRIWDGYATVFEKQKIGEDFVIGFSGYGPNQQEQSPFRHAMTELHNLQ